MKRIKELLALLLMLCLVFSLSGCRIKDGKTDEQPVQADSVKEAIPVEDSVISPEGAAQNTVDRTESSEPFDKAAPEVGDSDYSLQETNPESPAENDDTVEITIPEGMEIDDE